MSRSFFLTAVVTLASCATNTPGIDTRLSYSRININIPRSMNITTKTEEDISAIKENYARNPYDSINRDIILYKILEGNAKGLIVYVFNIDGVSDKYLIYITDKSGKIRKKFLQSAP